jgi:ethanolamine utilization protein EutN
MILGKVIGCIVSSTKLDCYQSQKILLVKAIDPRGVEQSQTFIAVDTIGAGKGDVILLAAEGKAASEILGLKRSALRSVIIGIVDKINFTVGKAAEE